MNILDNVIWSDSEKSLFPDKHMANHKARRSASGAQSRNPC